MLKYRGKLKKSRFINGNWNMTYSSTNKDVPSNIIEIAVDYPSDLKWIIKRDEFENIELIKENGS